MDKNSGKEELALEMIKRIKALAEAGLVYTPNEYDRERFEELHHLSLQLMEMVTEQPLAVLKDFFLPPVDYPTPKVDVRGLVLNEAKEVLLVKEGEDQKWSLPGGWADIGFSPSEVVVKEIQEETGLTARVSRLLAVFDKKFHPHPPQPFYVYKFVFLCEAMEGELQSSFDIEEVRYFKIQELPELSEDRILKSQIVQLYEKVVNNDIIMYCD